MQFYFRENKVGITALFYDVTDVQLEHIVNNQYKSFPTRFFTKKIFSPMISLDMARRVAKEKSNWLSDNVKNVHILRFFVRSKFLERYVRGSLDNENSLIHVPAADLNKVNQQIIGYIERIESVDLTQFC